MLDPPETGVVCVLSSLLVFPGITSVSRLESQPPNVGTFTFSSRQRSCSALRPPTAHVGPGQPGKLSHIRHLCTGPQGWPMAPGPAIWHLLPFHPTPGEGIKRMLFGLSDQSSILSHLPAFTGLKSLRNPAQPVGSAAEVRGQGCRRHSSRTVP